MSSSWTQTKSTTSEYHLSYYQSRGGPAPSSSSGGGGNKQATKMSFGRLRANPSSAEDKGLVANVVEFAGSLVPQAVLAALVYYDLIKLHPRHVTEGSLSGFAARVEYALHYHILLACWLLINVVATMFMRVRTGAVNPLDETTEGRVKRIKAVLTNSFESIVLSIFLQLIFVSFASPGCVLKNIPLINIIQLIGRMVYCAGYPMRRVFGFGMTLVPNALMAIYNLYKFGQFLRIY